MSFDKIKTVYFLGIGGIGMSAIARYFHSQNKKVWGYDKTQTELTEKLGNEGIHVHYKDKGEEILQELDVESTLVIYTPAIPKEHGELIAFQNNNYQLIKRAKALGIISEQKETFAIAGTHGKTTTSAILTHVLYQTKESCNAFIGGISTNYETNFLLAPHSNKVVLEADEFDRSFLQLKPNYSIITSIDADHLDIYGESDSFKKSFYEFAALTNPTGIIMHHADIDLSSVQTYSKKIAYGFGKGDWKGENLRYENGILFFDIINGNRTYPNIEFGISGKHNAENALAVFALLMELNYDETHIRQSFQSFKGVKRRFEYHIQSENLVIIDDYAHHPTELSSFLHSLKEIYPSKKITVVFQPHLFSRTRDFIDEFAKALALGNQLFLLDIYPARELPIEGVNSQVLLDKVELNQKYISSKESIVADLKKANHEVIAILGAGDIDTCVKPIVKAYSN